MNEVFFLTLFCAGMSELVTHNGGIVWLIDKLQKFMKDKKSAQVGISTLAALTDCATANNTVAIVVTGKVARDVSRAYRVDPRKTASLLDIFSCHSARISAVRCANVKRDGFGECLPDDGLGHCV